MMRNKALAVTLMVALGLLWVWTAMVTASIGELELVDFPSEIVVTGDEVQLEGWLKFNEKEHEYGQNIRLWVTRHEGRVEPDFIKGPIYDGEMVPITVYLEGVPGAATIHADDAPDTVLLDFNMKTPPPKDWQVEGYAFGTHQPTPSASVRVAFRPSMLTTAE